MASWCLTVAVGFLFFCIQGHATHGKAVTKPKETETASDIPPGEDGFYVTLEVFSGVPDPQWMILQDNPKYSEIKRLFDSAPGYKPEENAPPRLGYEGFALLEVRNGINKTEKLIVGRETEELQKLLLQSAPEGKISTNIKEGVKKEIRSVSPVNLNSAKRFAPPWRPNYWNNAAHVRDNNCYNYASTIRNDNFQQPGDAANKPFPWDFTAEDVKNASLEDGCVFRREETHMCAPSGDEHLAALFVYIGASGSIFDKDYHWYRLDNNGYWSHKPGETPATDRDGNGDRIRDPREAAQGFLAYEFVCFMTIDVNTIKIPKTI